MTGVYRFQWMRLNTGKPMGFDSNDRSEKKNQEMLKAITQEMSVET